MKGKIVGGKPLYVAVAEKKETRQARLMQAIFANARPVVAPPLMSTYRTTGPGQHMYRSDPRPPTMVIETHRVIFNLLRK